MKPKSNNSTLSSDEHQEERVASKNCDDHIMIKGVSLPASFLRIEKDIENFEVRDDDIWLCGYPRSGTTWSQEMVWCIANDLDFEGAKEIIPERFPYFEHSGVVDQSAVLSGDTSMPEYMLDSVNFVTQKPKTKPRFIKTHLHFHLLPRQLRTGEKKAKMIYVSRNPKDVCISMFHFCQLKKLYSTNFETICELFLNGKMIATPFWDHVLGFWNRRSKLQNCLFLRYEDMKRDLPSVIQKVARFLGKGELSSEQMKLLTDHLSIENMKKNPAVNAEDYLQVSKKYDTSQDDSDNESFIRTGKLNGWKEEMSPEMISRFDEWTKDNLKNSDYQL